MEKVNKTFANINYIGIATIVIGLVPIGTSMLVPTQWDFLEIVCLFLFSIFSPLVLFSFMDPIKEGFQNAELLTNIKRFSSLLLFSVVVLSLQTFNLIGN